jgi:hypothetical protein
MSKNGIPKGYTSQTVSQLTKESQQTLFELGEAAYNEQFSIRRQEALQERLKELEAMMLYARRQEQAKEVAKKNADEKSELKSESATGETDAPNASQV